MSPTIRNDPNRPSGGYAILEGEGLAGITALTIENVASGLFLSGDGRWAKLSHLFQVEAEGQGLRLGPAIVDHVPEELLIALRSSDGLNLGRLFWLDVMPSRGRRVVAPVFDPPVAPTASPVAQEPEAPKPPEAREPSHRPEPPLSPVIVAAPVSIPQPARRSLRRPALAALALAALLAAGGAWALLRRPAQAPIAYPAVQDQARRCADSFGAKVAAGLAGADDDRIKTAEMALSDGCGAQALAALDGVDWEMNESAAWRLARFYDPNETDPIVRDAGSRHPDWAATYYAHWASRAPREAAALRHLCTTDAATLDANAQLKRACGR